MAHIRGPPLPAQFFFRCSTCGTYRVSEETARKFLTKKLRKKLDESVRKGAHGAILTFLNGCPNCRPDNKAVEIELSALWPKVH
jgi:hypothetical protein